MISLRDVKYKLRHKGDKIIFVNPTILLDKLEKTSYGVRQPSGQIGNRVQRAKEYILKYWDDPRAKKFPMFEPSVVGIYGSPGMEYVSFEDGRHRLLAAEELDIPEVAIEIPRRQEPKFEYMKVKKMNESPDFIKSGDYNLSYTDVDAIPFIGHIQNDNSIIVGIGDEQGNHSTVIKTNFEYDNKGKLLFELNYSGRLWINKKIMAFWRYPDQKSFIEIINKLEKMLDLKMWNNNWKIEILINNDKIVIQRHIRFEEGTINIIPIEDYIKSEDFPEELKQKHIMSWKEKEELRKKSSYPSKQKPLDWKQALYQESVNKEIIYTHIMKTFEEFINENNNLSFDRDTIFKVTGQAPLEFDENPGYVSFKTLSPAGARSAVKKLIDSGYNATVTMGRYIKIEKLK